ncbi:hypothetical protein Avbf_04597 [Armadillidium vulgare]|nr:hypothetical protein Avbf_04597 [Armadillidium vulgare]
MGGGQPPQPQPSAPAHTESTGSAGTSVGGFSLNFARPGSRTTSAPSSPSKTRESFLQIFPNPICPDSSKLKDAGEFNNILLASNSEEYIDQLINAIIITSSYPLLIPMRPEIGHAHGGFGR